MRIVFVFYTVRGYSALLAAILGAMTAFELT
jgi:hypothetical protein